MSTIVNYIQYKVLPLEEIKRIHSENKEDVAISFLLSKQREVLKDPEFAFKLFSTFSLSQYEEWVGKRYMDLRRIKFLHQKFPSESKLNLKLLRCQIIQSNEAKELRNSIFHSLDKEEIVFWLENASLTEDSVNSIVANFGQDQEILLMLVKRKLVKKNEHLLYKVLKLLDLDSAKEVLLDSVFLKLYMLKTLWKIHEDKELAYLIAQRPNSREDNQFYIEVFNYISKKDILLILDESKNEHLSVLDCYLVYNKYSDDLDILLKVQEVSFIEKEKSLNELLNLRISILKKNKKES